MMTPAELGQELLRLRERGELTRGKGSELVERASELEMRRRRLVTLSTMARSLANAADLAARDRLRLEVSDELVRERIETLRKAIDECEFQTMPSIPSSPDMTK
jgi:DNA-binding MarR family transcriptional regulator